MQVCLPGDFAGDGGTALSAEFTISNRASFIAIQMDIALNIDPVLPEPPEIVG